MCVLSMLFFESASGKPSSRFKRSYPEIELQQIFFLPSRFDGPHNVCKKNAVSLLVRRYPIYLIYLFYTPYFTLYSLPSTLFRTKNRDGHGPRLPGVVLHQNNGQVLRLLVHFLFQASRRIVDFCCHIQVHI